jgi:hypothetical protein
MNVCHLANFHLLGWLLAGDGMGDEQVHGDKILKSAHLTQLLGTL